MAHHQLEADAISLFRHHEGRYQTFPAATGGKRASGLRVLIVILAGRHLIDLQMRLDGDSTPERDWVR